MTRGAAATVALALGSLLACAPRAARDGMEQAELARALAPAGVGDGVASRMTAIPPATLTVVHPPTPLRGANGLACFDLHLTIAEALGDRVLRASADGSLETIALPSGLRGPDDLVYDETGTLFVTAAASGDVWRRDRMGGWSTIATGLRGVNAIARDATGRLFVSTCELDEDGLFELDSKSGNPPRVIARDLGCPNAMVAEEDGSLVVPLLHAGKVVRVRTDDGQVTVIADGLEAPSAVKRAPDGSLVVLESATGAIRSLGNATSGGGPGIEVARLSPGLDGFTTCGESALVSNFVTGEIVAFKPWPGSFRVLEPSGLASPRGLAQAGDEILLSDGVSIKRLHGSAAEVVVATAIDPIPPPYGLAIAPGGLAWITVPHLGEIHRIDLNRRTSTKITGGLDWPSSIVAAPRGGVFVADSGAGRVVHVDADGTTNVIASGLIEPLGLALRGSQILTVEPDGGRVLALRDGSPPALVASGLAGPVGIAVDASGRVFIAEKQTGNLVRVDSDGSRMRIAQGFDFRTSGSQPAAVPLLVDGSGSIVVALPHDGSVVRVTP